MVCVIMAGRSFDTRRVLSEDRFERVHALRHPQRQRLDPGLHPREASDIATVRPDRARQSSSTAATATAPSAPTPEPEPGAG